MKASSFPLATYRVQVNHQFRFEHVQALVDYFHLLGISHLYSSPVLKAQKGSLHGYDVTDPSMLNPEIGTSEDFEKLVKDLHAKSLGILLDIVPNHMFIGNDENPWWNAVLEKGQQSSYATFFDIDWHPPEPIFQNKIFLPLLDRPFGKALENQMLTLCQSKGCFQIYVDGFFLPTDPQSWRSILEPACEEMQKVLSASDPDVIDLKIIIRDLNASDINHRIERLLERQPLFQEKLKLELEAINGIQGNPFSFDRLEIFLQSQHYRLCYWRIANDEINYRRFFDIFQYASIRMEKKETFDAVHALIFDFLKKGWINGLRIDHIDGLWDPQQYLENLSKNIGDTSIYVIAEKILMGDEPLRQDWVLNGTVGYDFLNQVNGVFVYQNHHKKLTDIYQKFTGQPENISELKYACKKLILNRSLASELHLLTIRLKGVSEKHRYFQDLSFESLKKALSELIACFPVYRTYIRAEGYIHEEDRKSISFALAWARRIDTIVDRSVYEFIEDLLFFKYPPGVEASYKAACEDFVMHFQQVTGPVMAKGLEDTAFYHYYPLSSLNEVGGDPGIFGISKEIFHKKNAERCSYWPDSLLATTTHDTKRSEDVRARINVLSEIPDEWQSILVEWSAHNQKHKVTVGDELVPDANEEYLLYQTLLGSWPFDGIDEIYIKRIQDYMQKAVKEAKINSTWVDPHEAYDAGVSLYIQRICEDKQFRENFISFSSKIADWGMLNSLSQLVLKLTSPGIPDIYQGCESWNFTLVDPDNRHPIDYAKYRQRMHQIEILEDCLKIPRDGRIKLFMTQKILQLRQRSPDTFRHGSYLPLDVEGPMKENIIAYARIFEEHAVLVITTRFFTFFMENFHDRNVDWEDVHIKLPQELAQLQFRDIFNGQIISNQLIDLQTVFSKMPFAVLESY